MARTFDIEVWLPSTGGYVEVSSVSNARDYQARRGNIRCRPRRGRSGFVHPLNGSGLATSRQPPALLQQHQRPDGMVAVPRAVVDGDRATRSHATGAAESGSRRLDT